MIDIASVPSIENTTATKSVPPSLPIMSERPCFAGRTIAETKSKQFELGEVQFVSGEVREALRFVPGDQHSIL